MENLKKMTRFMRSTRNCNVLDRTENGLDKLLTSGLHDKARRYFGPHFEETVFGSKPRTKSGGVTLITLVPGAGNEAAWDSVREILRCAGAPVEFEYINHPGGSDPELENILLSIKRNGIGVKGNIERHDKPVWPGSAVSRNMALRRALDLFVRINWIKSVPPLRTLMKVHNELDILLIRQNTEGEFSLLEYMPLPKMCEHLAIVTSFNSTRIAEFAFKYSKERERKKITLIVNKMVIPKSEELFSQAFLDAAKNYPELEHEVLDVAGFTLKLQYEADTLDVILASSLIGSLLHSILQGYLGSAQLIPSLNVGDRYKVWESAFVSSMSEHANMGDATNLVSHIFIFISILKELGAVKAGDAMFLSLMETLSEGVKPPGLGGTATINEFTRFFITCLKPKVGGVQCSFDDKPRLPPKPPPTAPFRPEFMPGMVPPNPDYKRFPPHSE